MSAITTRTNPHGAGWTASNFEDDGSGNSKATNTAVDADGTFDTAQVETNSAGATTATITKMTLDGGLEAGSEIWLKFDIIDANNFSYVRLRLQALTLFNDVKNDEVQIWKVVADSHSQIPPHTLTRRLGLTPGDLRHYLMEIRQETGFHPTLSVMTSIDQIIVKISAKDSMDFHKRDTDDRLVLKATSARNAAIWTTGGKVGVRLIGGTHSNKVKKFQTMLMDSFWMDPVAGNDANVGSFQAPKKSFGGQSNDPLVKGLFDIVRENDVGYVKGGTIRETIVNITGLSSSHTPVTWPTAQTSFEDGPFFTTYGNEQIVWETNNNTGCLWHRGANNWITFQGRFKLDARDQDGLNTNCIKLWAQTAGGSGATSKHWRLQDLELANSGDGSCLLINHGTFSGTPTPAEYDQFHEILDLDVYGAKDPGSSQGVHGLYLEPSYHLVEYCLLHDNEGNGMKFSYGTNTGFNGVKVTNNNIARFNAAWNNWHYGFLTYSGIANQFDYNQAWNCAFKVAVTVGMGVYKGAELTHFRQNVVWNCGHTISGQKNACMGVVCPDNNTFVPGPIYFDGNTTFGGRGYNFTIFKNFAASIVGDVHLTNHVFRAPEVGDIHLDPGTALATNENNWFSTTGNPKFKNELTFDFTLADDSPLKNAGQDYPWSSPIDHRRLPIPQSVSRPIGAYEIENPLPSELAIAINPNFAGSINTLIGLPAVVTDPGNRGRRLYVKALNGVVTATPSGTGTVKGGGV